MIPATISVKQRTERGMGPWVGYIISGCELYEAGEKVLVWPEGVIGLVCGQVWLRGCFCED